jgi:hypothetical protein
MSWRQLKPTNEIEKKQILITQVAEFFHQHFGLNIHSLFIHDNNFLKRQFAFYTKSNESLIEYYHHNYFLQNALYTANIPLCIFLFENDYHSILKENLIIHKSSIQNSLFWQMILGRYAIYGEILLDFHYVYLKMYEYLLSINLDCAIMSHVMHEDPFCKKINHIKTHNLFVEVDNVRKKVPFYIMKKIQSILDKFINVRVLIDIIIKYIIY